MPKAAPRAAVRRAGRARVEPEGRATTNIPYVAMDIIVAIGHIIVHVPSASTTYAHTCAAIPPVSSRQATLRRVDASHLMPTCSRATTSNVLDARSRTLQTHDS